MAGKTSTTTKRKSKRSATSKTRSKKVSLSPKKSKASVGRPRSKKSTPKAKQALKPVSSNSELEIPMEKVNTVKGIIELPKRRRGRPAREEEELREKILKEHVIIGDPRVKRPRGRPRKDQNQNYSSDS